MNKDKLLEENEEELDFEEDEEETSEDFCDEQLELSPDEEIDVITESMMVLIDEINSRKQGFSIDVSMLSDDVQALAAILANNPPTRDINLDLDRYEALNETLIRLTGGIGCDTDLIYDQLYQNDNKLDFHLNKNEYKEQQCMLKPMFENQDLIKTTFKNYRQTLKDAGHIHLPFWDMMRVYSPSDFKDIILSYYATYDNRIYNIAKKYFDERRIELDTSKSNYNTRIFSIGEAKIEIERLKKIISELAKNPNPTKEEIKQVQEYNRIINSLEYQIKLGEKQLKKSQYINLLKKLIKKSERELEELLNKSNTTEEEGARITKLEKLLEEYNEELDNIYNGKIEGEDYLGYYASATSIASGYIYATGGYDSFTAAVVAHELGHAIEAELYDFPQQKKFSKGPYYETSSQIFETGFENYLIDQKIDEIGGLIAKNSDYNDLLLRSLLVEKELNKGMKLNPKRKLVTAEDGRTLSGFNFLYAFGKYYGEHLAKIKREDPYSFFEIYNNFISHNHYVDMEELISYLGLSKEEFSSCSVIKDTIEEDTKSLQKKLFKK